MVLAKSWILICETFSVNSDASQNLQIQAILCGNNPPQKGSSFQPRHSALTVGQMNAILFRGQHV